MRIRDLQRDWDTFGRNDPFWAILTAPRKRGGKWQPGEFFDTGTREIADLMGYVESLGFNLFRRKALDFGCGAGRLSQALTFYFEEVYGVDVAPSMIRLANSLNQRGCIYRLNSATCLSLFKDNTFDFIYSSLCTRPVD